LCRYKLKEIRSNETIIKVPPTGVIMPSFLNPEPVIS